MHIVQATSIKSEREEFPITSFDPKIEPFGDFQVTSSPSLPLAKKRSNKSSVLLTCPYPGCHKQYDNFHSFKQHKGDHKAIDQKRHMCDKCQKVFTRRHKLNNHKKKCKA